MLPSQGRGRGFKSRLPLMKKCEICPYVENPDCPIFDNKYWIVNLAVHDQYYPGRAYVTTKRHVSSLSELMKEEWDELKIVVGKFEKAVKAGLGASLCNWSCLMNNAFQEKPYNPHVHWHVRPRYKEPISVQGETFTDELFGKHYKKSTDRVVPKAVEQEIVSRIKSFL